MNVKSFNSHTPLGILRITLVDRIIHRIEMFSNDSVVKTDGQHIEIQQELSAYLNGERRKFSLPLALNGTAFQKKIWLALQKIPYGTTKTYGELAKELGTSARAIGNACRQNPIPIIVPCHRIVAANGIGGFSGQTVGDNISAKRWLLERESGIKIAS